MKNHDNTIYQTPTQTWVARTLTFTLLVVIGILAWSTGYAQSSDWVDPVVNIVDDIGAGMQILGASLIVIACAIVGIISMLSGNIPWRWVQGIAGGGAILFFGATAARTLFGI